MSESTPEPTLSPCGCCEGAHADEPVRNAPGLPALRYRLATHAGFLERMLYALPLTRPLDSDPRPLARLTARTPGDPTVALLDACASVADILTFYQERIANEGFLRTATERRSVLELARAIGYELAPGLAASVHLSITVEDAPGAPGVCKVPRGTQVQSVPPQDKLPQVFETSVDFTARAEWNALRPRLTRPADLAIVADRVSPPGARLCLVGPPGSFPPDTPDIMTEVDVAGLHRLDPILAAGAMVDAVPVTRIYFTEAAANLARGELLLFVGKQGDDADTLILRVADVALEPDGKRVRVDLEPLPPPTATESRAVGLKLFPYLIRPALVRATPRLTPLALDRANVESIVLSKTWGERELQALLGIQRWPAASLIRTARTRPPAPPIAVESGAFAFRDRVAFFGHNAPRYGSLPVVEGKDNPYPSGWDVDDKTSTGGTLGASRTIWTNSQGEPLEGTHVYLERPVAGVVQKSWIIVESPDQTPTAFPVYDAREASRADYGLSARAMAVTFADDTGGRRFPAPTQPEYRFRTSTARANSVRLELAELPIASPVERGATAVELDAMVLGLASGQAMVFRGERADLPGVEAAEVVTLADVVHGGGRTTLLLRDGLANTYVRHTLTVNANVVHATHGETVREVLGSGDASQANQQLALTKPPLTYVSGATPRGSSSTLEIRVNGVRWEEVGSLYGVDAGREVYVVRIDDDAKPRVIFGDGVQGARLPTGAVNVAAIYRSGIGPDGEVEADSLTVVRTLPLGLRGVTNALPARGAEGPERLDDARRNGPLTVLTFDRVVSLSDHEDFARTFPGIGKALADRLLIGGRDVVHLTVAGATGGEPGADVVANLRAAVLTASDGSHPSVVAPFLQRYFTCATRVAVDPRFVAAEVLAAVEARLRTAFGFEARQLGQSVTASEVVTLIQGVAGVVAVDLESLAVYQDDETASAAAGAAGTEAVAARRARVNPATGAIEPAELLLVNPVGIVLTTMAP